MSRKGDADITRAAVVLAGREVALTIRRSGRARRLRLRMLPETGLEVVLPLGASHADALAFVRREADWVLRELARVPRQAPLLVLADGATTPYLGASLPIRLIAGRSPALTEGVLTVPTVGGFAAVERWYRAEARRLCAERAAIHAASLGVAFGRLAIKDTRSRWGSCSSKRNLNFSWRLVMAPAEVLDYVVAHEVAHLREMNHSARFWALVESLCPRYRDHRRWLRANGPALAAWPRVVT